MSKSSKKQKSARAETVEEPKETAVSVEEPTEEAPTPPPETVKPDLVVKPKGVPRPQMRQQTPAQELTKAATARRPRFRVEQDHKTIGRWGVTMLAAGSLVSEATHDLVQLAEEGAILVKV